MKKFLFSSTILLLLLFSTSCGNDNKTQSDIVQIEQNTVTSILHEENKEEIKNVENSQNSNILIVYFSMPEDVNTDGVNAITGTSIVMSEEEKLGNIQYIAQIIQQNVGGELFRIETVQDYPLEHDTLVE